MDVDADATLVEDPDSNKVGHTDASVDDVLLDNILTDKGKGKGRDFQPIGGPSTT